MMYEKILKEFYFKKPVLVTGGAGFIGSNLVERLVAFGAKVTVIDNLSSGKVSNMRSFLHRIKFFYADLTDFALVRQLIDLNFEVIFHMAAVSSVPWAERDPLLCKAVNEVFLENYLNLLSGKELLPKIVFSSSSSVYGNANDPCKEDSSVCPSSCYAKSKWNGEVLLKRFAESFGATVFALRYFNVFGKRARKVGATAPVTTVFKRLVVGNKPVKIFGNGLQLRDYVSVKKVVLANLFLPTTKYAGWNVFNIASGKTLNLLELLQMICIENKCSWPQVEFCSKRDGDVLNSIADSSKFDNLLKD